MNDKWASWVKSLVVNVLVEHGLIQPPKAAASEVSPAPVEQAAPESPLPAEDPQPEPVPDSTGGGDADEFVVQEEVTKGRKKGRSNG